MAEFHLAAAPALAADPVEVANTRLAVARLASLITLVLRPGDPAALAAELDARGLALPEIGASEATAAGDRLLRPTRERAYLLGPVPDTGPAATFYALDQTGFWLVLSLTGPGARPVLERGWKPDLAGAAFPVGAVTRSTIGQVPVTLSRREAQGYLLMAPRSYGAALWHELETSLRLAL